MTLASDYVVNYDTSITSSGGTVSMDLGTGTDRVVLCMHARWTPGTVANQTVAPKVDGSVMTALTSEITGWGANAMNNTYFRMFKYESPPEGSKVLTSLTDSYGGCGYVNIFICFKKVSVVWPFGTAGAAADSTYIQAVATDARAGNIHIAGLCHANWINGRSYGGTITGRGAGQENLCYKNGDAKGYGFTDLKMATQVTDSQTWTWGFGVENHLYYSIPLFIRTSGIPVAASPYYIF
jgi:hypothetical protein